MGERRRKRDRFFADNPFCCFCGGDESATTVDHVPNRASFRGKVGPEGFEFPACDQCQQSTRLDEIAFAFMVHFLAEEGDEPEEKAAAKLKSGLKNNLPHLWSFAEPTAREKRRAAKELELRLPPGAISEAPLVKIGTEWGDHLERYLAKLVRALYYKHVGAAAPIEWVAWSMWTYARVGVAQPALDQWIEMTPFVTVGQRINADLGHRFAYRWNYTAPVGAFACIGQFGDGFRFYATLMRPDVAERITPKEPAQR